MAAFTPSVSLALHRAPAARQCRIGRGVHVQAAVPRSAFIAGMRPALLSASSARQSTRMSMGGGRGSPLPPFGERILSMLPYVIPLLDSLSFGMYVFSKVPLLGSVLLVPLYPVYSVYRGIPFLAFGVFLALYLLVVRNTSISRFIRFNTYQALMLDIALIFPQLFAGLNLGGAIPPSVVETCSTAVFYAVSLAVAYSVVSNAKGEIPDQIPAISDSVYQQMGPM